MTKLDINGLNESPFDFWIKVSDEFKAPPFVYVKTSNETSADKFIYKTVQTTQSNISFSFNIKPFNLDFYNQSDPSTFSKKFLIGYLVLVKFGDSPKLDLSNRNYDSWSFLCPTEGTYRYR